MKKNHIKNILSTLDKRSKQASRKCLFKNCQNSAIKSHLLQKRGIINQIAKGNHVWELGMNRYKPNTFQFQKVGLNDAFTFPGFCANHDSLIFKPIEVGNVDYTLYESQLLFSYRAIMNEKRKKEIMIDYNTRIYNSNQLRMYLTDEYFDTIRESIDGNNDGIVDEEYYESFFIENIENPNKRDFSFLTFELPKVELCSSAVFSYETTHEINYMLRYESYKATKPLTEIYFNLLPVKDRTIVIIGCLTERKPLCWDYIENFKQQNPYDSLKLISDLLLCQVENWLCSENMYQNNLKLREKEIIRITHESIRHMDERRKLNFNLFEKMPN